MAKEYITPKINMSDIDLKLYILGGSKQKKIIQSPTDNEITDDLWSNMDN